MNPEPLIEWPHVLQELQTFVSIFMVAGAIGFRWSGLRAAEKVSQGGDERTVLDRVYRAVAATGLIGALWTLILFATRLPDMARRKSVAPLALVITDLPTALQAALLAITLLGFVLAFTLRNRPIGWVLAAIGFVGATLRSGLLGQWNRVVNPVHRAAGGVWIGSLFLLVAFGMAIVLRSQLPGERRGRLAAQMVHGFSPMALAASMVLVGFGIITAVQHIPWFGALWTTPYGITFLIKLALVSMVFALGAFHWLGMRPKLGAEEQAGRLLSSARTELIIAIVVLLVTAVLVSLPTPKLPGT